MGGNCGKGSYRKRRLDFVKKMADLTLGLMGACGER